MGSSSATTGVFRTAAILVGGGAQPVAPIEIPGVVSWGGADRVPEAHSQALAE